MPGPVQEGGLLSTWKDSEVLTISYGTEEPGACFTESEGPNLVTNKKTEHTIHPPSTQQQIFHSRLVASYDQPWFANPMKSCDGKVAHIIFNKITSGHSDQ
ncbi:hypothetical protein JCM5296_001956 [Sporobolomyces johnsonii]